MPVRRESGRAYVPRRPKRRPPPSRGGHPSRGGTTVGGGTRGRAPRPYRSPTPSIPEQRKRRTRRPAPKRQPGPISKRQRTRIDEFKRLEAYIEAQLRYRYRSGAPGVYTDLERILNDEFLREDASRRQGEAQRRYRTRGGSPGVFTDAERREVSEFQAVQDRTQPGPFTDADRRRVAAYYQRQGKGRIPPPVNYQRPRQDITGRRTEGSEIRLPGPVEASQAVTEFLSDAARKVQQTRTPSKKGTITKGPGGLPIASTVPPGGTLKITKAGEKVSGRILSDALNIGAQAIPSLYELGAATVEAAKGDSRRAEKLWRQYKETGVLPAIVAGDPKEFVKRLAAHPLAGALELRGGQVIVTRAGARGTVHGARLVAKGTRKAGGRRNIGRVERKANEILSTRRGEDVPGLGFVQQRTRGRHGEGKGYSRDLLVKAEQARRDRRRRKKTGSTLTKADIDAAVRGRVDHAEGVSEMLRRESRAEIERLAKRFPARYAAVGRLILEGQVRPGRMRADLLKVRDQIEQALPSLRGEKLAVAKRNLAQIDQALGDKRLLRGEGLVFARLKKYAEGINRIDQKLLAAGYRTGAMGKSKHVPWLVTHEGARAGTKADAGPTGRVPWMLDREGREITEDRIPEMAAKHGVDVDGVAWISQRQFELSERGAHYQRGDLTHRPWVAKQRRTGEATKQGVVDLSRDAVIEDAFRRQSVLDAVDGNLRMLNSVGAVGLRLDENGIGGFRVVGDAKKAYRDLRRDEKGNERPWVPDMEVISLAPFFKTRRELAQVTGKVTKAADMDEFAGWLLRDYDAARAGGADSPDTGRGLGDASGPYVLVPKAALEQASRHARNLGPGDAGKAFQAATHAFRQTVLLTSSRWFAGNMLEMLFRTVFVEGIGPRGWYTGRKALKTAERLDPARARELRVATTGGAHISTVERFHTRRLPDQFDEGGILRPLATFLNGVANRKVSPAHYPVLAWRAWAVTIRGVNRWVERQGQFAALGKAARREWRDMTAAQGRSMLAGEKAWNDLAKGMLNTSAQKRFADEVDTVIGKYDRFSPAMRHAMTNYAPFLAWYLNSLRFIFITLPGRHPVKTSILASTYATQAEKLRTEGRDPAQPGGIPGFLVGGLNIGGREYRIQHYFPFSAVSEGAAPLADMVLPQLGFLETAAGLHFTGNKIKRPDGQDPSQLELLGLGMYGLAESMIPMVSVARRIRESGGTGHAFSTAVSPKTTSSSEVEPDTDLLAGLERTFNPFYPVGGRKRGPVGGGSGAPDWAKGSSSGSEVPSWAKP